MNQTKKNIKKKIYEDFRCPACTFSLPFDQSENLLYCDIFCLEFMRVNHHSFLMREYEIIDKKEF